MSPAARPFGVILLAALVALATSFAWDSLADHRSEEPSPSSAVPAAFPPATDPDWTIADVAESVVDGVVNISSERVTSRETPRFGPFFDDPFFRHFFGDRFRRPNVPSERRERSLGSGVIVDKEGTVVTNNHVVAGAESVKVTLSDGREVNAEIVGTDPPTDLAVLRIKDDVSDLHPLAFGDSDSLRLGDVVLAVGNPFGLGKTVTLGIVSAKGRANVGVADYEDFIQTDAAINPGNSGGALVDRRGRLVGINTAIVSRTGGYQGIGFAIPSNMAELVIDALLEHGEVERGWLGVSIQDITPDLAEALDLEGRKGVLVGGIEEDSPAEKAGLERGDIILTFAGRPVDSSSRLRNLVAVTGANERVEIELLRDGKERTATVELGTLRSASVTTLDADHGALGGLTVGPLDEERRREFGVPDAVRHGVVVVEVARGSPAARAGFRPGDVILEINRKTVASVDGLRDLYDRARASVAILVQRGNTTLFLALRKP